MIPHPPAPEAGEYLWDEENQRWLPLIKTDLGHSDIEATIKAAE